MGEDLDGLPDHAPHRRLWALSVSTLAGSKPWSYSWERAQRTIAKTSSTDSPMKAWRTGSPGRMRPRSYAKNCNEQGAQQDKTVAIPINNLFTNDLR